MMIPIPKNAQNVSLLLEKVMTWPQGEGGSIGHHGAIRIEWTVPAANGERSKRECFTMICDTYGDGLRAIADFMEHHVSLQ